MDDIEPIIAPETPEVVEDAPKPKAKAPSFYRIRCKQTGFTTDIPSNEWLAHDAKFRSGYEVLSK